MSSTYNVNVIDYLVCWESDDLDSDFASFDGPDEHLQIIEAIFDQLQEDRAFRVAMAGAGFRRIESPRLDSAYVQAAVQQGLNILYLKFWADDGELINHRIIYAVDERPQSRRIVILGLMPREDNYEQDSDFGRRVLAAYRKRHLPAGRAGGH